MASTEKIYLPPLFEERIKSQLGAAYPDFLNSLSEQAPTSLRVNPKKSGYKNTALPIPWCSTGFYLEQRPSFTRDPTFHAGAYYVQEASSMFLEQAFRQCVDLTKNITVLDLCAAPGGKSTHILSLISADSLLVSNEVINSRASILSENIQKWGYTNNVVTNSDPEAFESLPGLFDVVVIDAPCSGEGLFRKDPSAINEWSLDNVALCSKRQRRIVSDVWSSLKEGGIMMYSTCTYNEQENEENLRWIADEHDVEFLSLKTDSSWGIVEVDNDGIKGYRFFPHKVNGEGLFLSVFRKKETTRSIPFKKQKHTFQSPSKSIVEHAAPWILDVDQKTFIQRDDLIQFFHTSHYPTVELLAQKLHIKSAGTSLATVKHSKLIPEHNVALSIDLNKNNFPVIALSEEEAIRYLKRENITVSTDQKGFTLVTYNDFSLGWVNVLDNRINNMYPQQWRIRM